MGRTKKDVVEYRIYDLPVDKPLVCLAGDEWRISDLPAARLHFHNCLEIGFCHSDEGWLRFEDEEVPFRAGDVFLIPRHVPHTTCSTPGKRSLWSYLFLDLEALANSATAGPRQSSAANVRWPSRYIHLTQENRDARLYYLASCLMEEARSDTPEAAQLLRCYALTMAAELNRYHRTVPQTLGKPSRSFPLRPALEYILDHYMEPCDAQTLAAMCHLSQTHFRRLFIACTDVTPLQFVNSTRIYQACILLATTNEPVLDIAQAVGMPSASSFNRNFQQIVGMSPRQYRASMDARSGGHRKEQVLACKGWTTPES